MAKLVKINKDYFIFFDNMSMVLKKFISRIFSKKEKGEIDTYDILGYYNNFDHLLKKLYYDMRADKVKEKSAEIIELKELIEIHKEIKQEIKEISKKLN